MWCVALTCLACSEPARSGGGDVVLLIEEDVGADAARDASHRGGEGDAAAPDDADQDAAPAPGPCPGDPPEGWTYTVGEPVFGERGFIEYVPGDLPIIIAAPHGGALEPDELAVGEGLAKDSGSQETARLLVEELRARTGGRTPHLIVNHVMRNRLNLNRPDARPNADHPVAIRAWGEFHAFAADAKAWVGAACGRGHFFDVHTNGGTTERWVEVGLGLGRDDLAVPDADFDTPARRASSFYRALAERPGVSFVEVIRGPTSVGGLLDDAGVAVVPSPTHPDPGQAGYYTGGYNSQAHGSRGGGVIDATQLELHFDYINSGSGEPRERKRAEFAATLAGVIEAFVELHYGFDLDAR
jgi:hypothetical protein